MKKSVAVLVFLAAACSALADAAAVISAASDFHKRCAAAIPEAQTKDPGALGHIPAHRLTALEGEIAVQDALRLQGAWARKHQKDDVARYCFEFTLSSLDALEHDIDECAATLKISGITISGEIARSRTEALEAIKHFRDELSADGQSSPQEKKG